MLPYRMINLENLCVTVHYQYHDIGYEPEDICNNMKYFKKVAGK